MELIDCHTHTFYSDGHSTVLENARRAQELGITTLCCTDHLTLPHEIDPTCEVSVAEEDLAAHAREVAAAREAFPQLDLVYGFECDYYAGCEPNIARWKGDATFLLGSVHGIDGRWIDDLRDLSYWDEIGCDAVWTRYFDTWCTACASPARFDSMAHPDLVMLLGRFPSFDLAPLYAQAASAARDAGVHVEINTAGLLKPVARMYPHVDFLRAFHAAGVPLTVGSDAHSVDRIGQNIERAYHLAREAGYRSVDAPTPDGDWRTIAL